jgi:hypothetical protein
VVLMPPGPELVRLLDDLRPAELALRDWVRTRMNASIVREMANADYGWEADGNREGIEDLMVARRLPEDLPWPPREVLELSSHSVPADPDVKPGSVGWRGHVARLFSCLILVRANDASRPAETVAGLVQSALELGPEATDHAVRYLAWCRLHEPGSWRYEAEQLPFLTLGLLLLYVMAPGPGDPRIAAGLAREFVHEVQALLPEWWTDEPPTAVLRAAASGSGWRTWRTLIDRCLIDDPAGRGGRLSLLSGATVDRPAVSVELLRSWAGLPAGGR